MEIEISHDTIVQPSFAVKSIKTFRFFVIFFAIFLTRSRNTFSHCFSLVLCFALSILFALCCLLHTTQSLFLSFCLIFHSLALYIFGFQNSIERQFWHIQYSTFRAISTSRIVLQLCFLFLWLFLSSTPSFFFFLCYFFEFFILLPLSSKNQKKKSQKKSN